MNATSFEKLWMTERLDSLTQFLQAQSAFVLQPRLVFIPQRVWNRGQCWEGIQPSGAGATALPFFISANHVSKRTMFATHSTSTTSTTRYNSDHALLNKMQMRIATLASISLHGKSVCVFWRILRFLVASYAVRL